MPDLSSDELPWPELGRWFAGELTPDEAAAMERWVAAERSRAQVVAVLREAWTAAGAAGEGWDAPAAIQRVREAAAGESRVIARLGRGRGLTAPRSQWAPVLGALRVAAVVALVAGGIVSIEWARHRAEPSSVQAAMAEYRTTPGQRLAFRLADGTQVMLAPGSVLRRSPDYGGRDRRVDLEGQAYFVVAHDSARPFSVHTSRLIARDLGTRFDVRAYPGDSASDVVVAEGKVAIQSGAAATLVAGQLGRADGSGRVSVRSKVDVPRYLAWIEGRLVFTDAPLGEVARQLERWYDIEVRLAGEGLSGLRVTGAFGDDPAPDALDAIAWSLGLTLHRAGKSYQFTRDPL